MKNLLIIVGLILSSNSFANCVELKERDLTVSWSAFKTQKKIAVGGKFPDFKLGSLNNKKFKSDKVSGSSIKDALMGTSIEIDTKTVDTNNPGRDIKIEEHFFGGHQSGRVIKGTVNKVSKDSLNLMLTLNGKKQEVPMTLTIKDNMVDASGHIDVLDFALHPQLAAINKACFALHEGKTWSHVKINIKAKFSSCSK